MDEFFSSESEADRAYAAAVGAEHPDREWVLSDRDVWYRNPYFTGTRTEGHPEDEPFCPEEGAETFGYNLAEVGYYLKNEARKAAEAYVPVYEDEIPF